MHAGGDWGVGLWVPGGAWGAEGGGSRERFAPLPAFLLQENRQVFFGFGV